VESRHRTLRATVEWSYQLLDEDEQRLFRHLAVFVDGVDLDTAELLAEEQCRDRDPGSVLARLVDASMLEVTFTGGTRYRMLETLRAFGLDRLAAVGEDDDATGHMIRWAVRLTARTAVDVASEREPEADVVLRRELANLRAAWRSARRRGPGDPEAVDAAVALVTNLSEAIAYRDLPELGSWADELAVFGLPTPSPRRRSESCRCGNFPCASCRWRVNVVPSPPADPKEIPRWTRTPSAPHRTPSQPASGRTTTAPLSLPGPRE
jgi:predicted ATPase